MDDPNRSSQDATVAQFLTTEHFNLQTERAVANADINARTQLYMSSLSATIITLALATQFSGGGDAFRGFAMVLLPTVYVFGLITLGRLGQAWDAWFAASQGMGRIRHYFAEQAPGIRDYLVMPTGDEPWRTLRGAGVSRGSYSWVNGLFTAPAALTLIDSVVAGVFCGVVASTLTDSRAVQAVAGVAGFTSSFLALTALGNRAFRARIDAAEVRFPDDGRS